MKTQHLRFNTIHHLALFYVFLRIFQATNAADIKSQGTGFFISEEGHIATCWHLVKGSSKIEAVTPDGQIHILTNIIHLDVDDVAILKPIKSIYNKINPLPVLNDSASVKSGDDVWTVGFPSADLLGTSPKSGQGIINSLSGPLDKKRFLQVSIPLQPGNSGGPLIDARGNVIGMIQASINIDFMLTNSGTIPQNVNYAIKCDSILWAAKMAKVTLVSRNIIPRTKDSRISATEDAVILIRASR